jgi:hypothetical protein
MDLETHPESLAKAHAAGWLAEVGGARHEEPSPAMAGAGAEGESPPAPDVAGLSDAEANPAGAEGGPDAEGGPEILASGMVIGPAQRRVRLVSDLSGQGQIWLARVVASASDAAEGAGRPFELRVLFRGGSPSSRSRSTSRPPSPAT